MVSQEVQSTGKSRARTYGLTIVLKHRGRPYPFRVKCRNRTEVRKWAELMGFTVPPRVGWFCVYVYEPIDFYYRLNSYFHARYAEALQADLRKALVERKKWPEAFAKKMPRASLIAIFVAFKLQGVLNRMGLSLFVENAARMALGNHKTF